MVYPDLEVSLDRRSDGEYRVEMRFSAPDSRVTTAPQTGDVRFKLVELGKRGDDTRSYGQLLAETIFGPPGLREYFLTARAHAEAAGAPLRLRLFVRPDAFELLDLRWETLRDPKTDEWLATSERILFSRYLPSRDQRTVRLEPKPSLRSLVIVANPSDLSEFSAGGQALPPVDVAGELQRARAALGKASVTDLAGRPATLDKICKVLRDGHDILYLVCHGAVREKQRQLWLENEVGRSHLVDAEQFVKQLAGIERPPRLVVLASCQSAGTGNQRAARDNGALAAIGPRLALAGIPAVVAMQGNVTMETVEAFMPVFFEELSRDGQVDRAVAAARAAIQLRPDSWMPVLYIRLLDGRLWVGPGFADEKFERWPALLASIEEGRCIPVLGSGLIEPLVGSSRELAARWAKSHHFPLATHEGDDLPQVAQYVAVTQDEQTLRLRFVQELESELRQRDLPEFESKSVQALLSAAGALRRERNQYDGHRVLAELPVPLYITTSPDNLLLDALRAKGKAPRLELCPWRQDYKGWPVSLAKREPEYTPTPECPLVMQLFGTLEDLETLVLKEDDYFAYLIGISANRRLLPASVNAAVAQGGLLFLGFRPDEWAFRVVFRTLLAPEAEYLGKVAKGRVNVAVQLDPEESGALEPSRARRYLEQYFQGARLTVYWGDVENFLCDLQQHWSVR